MPLESKFTGNVPEWLRGNFIFNGPGVFKIGDQKLNHVYDGMAVLQKFNIMPSGKVTYQNKIIKSEAYTRGNKENRIIFAEYGTKPMTNPSSGMFDK